VAPATDQKWECVYHLACSVDRLPTLVTALVDTCLPEPLYAILAGHWFGDRVDTFLSDFLPRARIDAAFAPHLSTLFHDGMVEHGFACYDANRHEEIFLDDHKELTVLTSEPIAVEQVFMRHGLMRNNALEFLSERGHGHTNLGGPESTYCRQIIQALDPL
jgi:hypothetical protein